MIDWLKPFYPTIKVLEVLGVIAALVAFSYDFLVEKPRERAVANATMLAQMASLNPEDATDRSAISAILLTLINADVLVEGISIPRLYTGDISIEYARFRRADFPHAYVHHTTFHEMNAEQTNFPNAYFVNVTFNGGGFQTEVNFPHSRRMYEVNKVLEMARLPNMRPDGSIVAQHTSLLNNLQGATFFRSSFEDFRFNGVNLSNVEFVASRFKDSVIFNSHMENTSQHTVI